MAIKTCPDCKKEFEYQKISSRYPKRYCPKCSAVRKKEYENIHTVTADDCTDE